MVINKYTPYLFNMHKNELTNLCLFVFLVTCAFMFIKELKILIVLPLFNYGHYILWYEQWL